MGLRPGGPFFEPDPRQVIEEFGDVEGQEDVDERRDVFPERLAEDGGGVEHLDPVQEKGQVIPFGAGKAPFGSGGGRSFGVGCACRRRGRVGLRQGAGRPEQQHSDPDAKENFKSPFHADQIKEATLPLTSLNPLRPGVPVTGACG